jgi:hypothetical protein
LPRLARGTRAARTVIPAASPCSDSATAGNDESGGIGKTGRKEQQMSPLSEAMMINGMVLFAALEADLGPARKIGSFRIIRPALVSAAIIPLFMQRPATHGTALLVEVAGVLAGLVSGLIVNSLMKVYSSPKTGKPVSRAGFGYAAFMMLLIGARAAFSYGGYHWFPAQLAQWCAASQVSLAAITDGLIFMAISLALTRSIGLGVRAARLRSQHTTVRALHAAQTI